MEEKLLTIKNNAISLILESKSTKELEEIRIQFLGRNGEVTQLTEKSYLKYPKKSVPKWEVLPMKSKNIIEDAIKNREEILKNAKSKYFPKIDVTEPGISPQLGHLHLITQAIREITAIFTQIGFTRVRYPEIDWDWYNFTALNFPENHPARDDLKHFILKEILIQKRADLCLTSIHQQDKYSIWNSLNHRLKCSISQKYTGDKVIFHIHLFFISLKTLVVGEKISISHLKGVLELFCKIIFWRRQKIPNQTI